MCTQMDMSYIQLSVFLYSIGLVKYSEGSGQFSRVIAMLESHLLYPHTVHVVFQYQISAFEQKANPTALVFVTERT